MPPAGAGAMVEALERWLRSLRGAPLCGRSSSGTVPLFDAIDICAELRELSGGNSAALADAVRAGPPEGPVALDAAGQAARLRTTSERVGAAAERLVLEAPGGGMSLLDLLEAGTVAWVLRGVPEAAERLELLRQALGASEHVEVSGSRATARGPPSAGACACRTPRLLEDTLGGDADVREPDADGSAPTPGSAFRTPSLGSEPGSSPGTPGGARSRGASPAGRGCATGTARPGAEAAAAAAGATGMAQLDAEAVAAAAGSSQLDLAPWWPGAEDQQFVPMCDGVGGQWVWCPLVLPVEGSPPTAAAEDTFFAGAPEEAGAAGRAPGGDDAFPPGLPTQPCCPRRAGSDAEAPEASGRSSSRGPSREPRAAASPYQAGAGAAAAPPELGLGAPPGPPAPFTALACVPGEGQWVWFPATDADAFEPAWGWEDAQWPEARLQTRSKKSNKSFANRHARVVNTALKTLENPPYQLADKMGPDGSVPINALLAADARLAEWCWHDPAQLVCAIRKTPECHLFLTADRDKLTVRALSQAERVRVLCEDYMLERQQYVAGPAPISELSQHPLVLSHVASMGAGAAASSDSECANTTELVVQALAGSTMLECGEHSVTLLPPSEPLCAVVERLLESDARLSSLLRSDGELPLAYLADHPEVRRMLERLRVDDRHSVLSSLRAAVEQLGDVELDASGTSFSRDPRPATRWTRPAATRDAGQRVRRDGSRKTAVKALSGLLSFYFDEFNLQHNKVLMARIESIRDTGGEPPFFRLSDVSALPRVGAVLSRYDHEGVGWLLEAACQDKGRMPVRLSWRSGRAEPVLELAYAPRFRYFEFVCRGPDTEFLLSPDVNPTEASGAHPLHVVCAVSYSVSSDLSHSQSPKAKDIHEQILIGDSDPNMLAWDERQKKLVRQLKMYNADVICLQGVQSVGLKERNSEGDPEWFACDDEPANNHLVYLYRDLSKANYGLVFAPVMQVPSSSALCLGNAILWKRSRWHMDTFSNVFQTAVVAVLKSKAGGPPLAACSYKPPDVWAQDWNERIAASELLVPAARAQDALAAAAREHGARPLWCGDFALETRELVPQLAAAAAACAGGAAPAWRSACESVMGSSPWTSAVKHSEGKATDLILHDQSLRALAVLGGPRESMGMLELLKAGNPSDHLFQVAAFSCAVEKCDRAALDGGPPGLAGAVGGGAGPGRRRAAQG